MSRADELRAKSRRLAQAAPAPARPVEAVPEDLGGVPAAGSGASTRGRPPVVRVRPVRLSVDLEPAVHSGLVRWAAEVGPEVGRSRIPTADVARVLLRRLLADEEWQRYVVGELRDP